MSAPDPIPEREDIERMRQKIRELEGEPLAPPPAPADCPGFDAPCDTEEDKLRPTGICLGLRRACA